MSEWKTYKLGDFVEINPRVPLKQGNEYSFVEMKDLDATFKYVSPSVRRELKGGSKFQNGDTLFARITPCLENGKICQVRNLENNVGFGSTEFLIFRGKENVSDNDFVYYLSRSEFVKNNAIQMMTGTSGRQRVEKSALEQLEISVPDLATQRQIAQILTSLDDKIELNLQMNQTLEAMAQSIFKEWFVNFNFPGFDGELVDGLPKGWKMGKVKDVCSVNSSTLSTKDVLEEIHYVEISEVDKGIINNIKKYTRGEEPSRAKRKLKHGDTVLSTVRPNRGSYFISLFPSENLIASTGFAVFSPISVPFSFLYFFLTNSEQLEFYGKMADGAAYPAINQSVIMDMDLIIPTNEILEAFHSVAGNSLVKCHNNLEENKILTQTRDTLLPKLMSGKITVK